MSKSPSPRLKSPSPKFKPLDGIASMSDLDVQSVENMSMGVARQHDLLQTRKNAESPERHLNIKNTQDCIK